MGEGAYASAYDLQVSNDGEAIVFVDGMENVRFGRIRIDLETLETKGLPERIFDGGFGNLFDVHAALRGGHDHQTRSRSVQQHAEVQFARDVASVFDVKALHFFAGWPRLFGHQHVAQHLLGVLVNLVDRIGHPHAAGAIRIVSETACASPASVNL